MGDPHPVATYLAGWFFVIAMAALSVRIIRRDLMGNWPRIRREFLANFERPVDVADTQTEQA